MRAFGAAIVFLFHFLGQTNPSWLRGVASDWRTQLGPQGVAIFFTMSGYLLFRPYVGAIVGAGRTPRLRPYAVRRFLRVVPAYWLALTGCLALFHVMPIRSVGDLGVLYGLVQNYREGWALVGLGVTWTLVVEISFYVVLPPFAAALRACARRVGSPAARLTVAALGVLVVEIGALGFRWWVSFHAVLPQRDPGAWMTLRTAQWWLLWHWDWFASGMLLAIAVAALELRPLPPRWVARCTRTALPSWTVAAVLYAVLCSLDLGQRGHASSRVASYWALVLEAVIAGVLVLPAVVGPDDGGRLRRALQTRGVVWFATISYGFYLWHITFVRQVNRWANDGHIPAGFAGRLACTLGLSLLAASASWYLVERRLVGVGRRVR